MRAFLSLLCAAALPGCIVPALDKAGLLEDSEDTEDPGVYVPNDDSDPWDTAVEDSAPVETDEDTGDGLIDTASAIWRPDTVRYAAELGVNAAGALTGYTIFGIREPAVFVVELSRGTRVCTVTYELVPAAWASSSAGAAHAGLGQFLTANTLLFGFVVDPTLTPATTTTPCDAIDPAFSTNLPNDALSLGTGVGVIYVGFDTTPEADVLQIYQGSGITSDQILGGRMKFPFLFGSPAQNYFPIGGIWAALDEFGEPQSVLGPTGYTLVLQSSVDAWTGTQPAEGFYRMLSIYQFTLTP